MMGQIFVYAQSSPYGSTEARYTYHVMLHMCFYDFMVVIYESTCVTKNKFCINKCLQDWSPSICRGAHATISVLQLLTTYHSNMLLFLRLLPFSSALPISRGDLMVSSSDCVS